MRLSTALYDRLDSLSTERGESMNALVNEAVARLLDAPELAPASRTADIDSRIAQDAVRRGSDAIGPLKGIAKHLSNLDMVALAAVVWAAAARLVAEADGPEVASVDFTRTAEVVERGNHHELAVVLYEQAIQLDTNNLEATNRLGQRLHHLAQRHDDLDRFRRAEQLLAKVTFLDNHAKLFHGWAAYRVAAADNDELGTDRARAELVEALKSWAFSDRDASSRRAWIRQLTNLAREPALQGCVEDLVRFANRSAAWEPIDLADVPADAAVISET